MRAGIRRVVLDDWATSNFAWDTYASKLVPNLVDSDEAFTVR
jgi:hypothetical protein